MRPGRGGRQTKPAAPREPESADEAYAEAVKRLARQPQSRETLRQALGRLGYTQSAVGAALDEAERHGYLNDRAYALSLVRRRASGRGQGLIAQELRAKGVDGLAAQSALKELQDNPEAELNHAATVGRSLLGRRKMADSQALLGFLAPRLARRGFSSGLVYRVCRLISAEWEAQNLFDSACEHN